METVVAVVMPEYCSQWQCELNVPGVREHGEDIGQGQRQLLLTDGERVAGPGNVTAETAEMNRLGVSQIRIAGNQD